MFPHTNYGTKEKRAAEKAVAGDEGAVNGWLIGTNAFWERSIK